MKNIFKNILYAGFIVFLVYTYQDTIRLGIDNFKDRFLPCSTPVYYAVGTLDERFGLSESDFLTYLKEAETKWDEALGKNLLEYREGSPLVVNLVYDKRQQVTDTLLSIGDELDTNKQAYNQMKLEYDQQMAAYNKAKADFEKHFARYQSENEAYNREVANWNNKGGAPSSVYESLSTEGARLRQEGESLRQRQDSLNDTVFAINQKVVTLNKMAKDLNLNVELYNEIGATQEAEFEEGRYYRGPEGEWIDIYQFENTTKLKRVLAHEFGHALGLEHVDDKDAIMYLLNTSNNLKITAADIAELNKVCNK